MRMNRKSARGRKAEEERCSRRKLCPSFLVGMLSFKHVRLWAVAAISWPQEKAPHSEDDGEGRREGHVSFMTMLKPLCQPHDIPAPYFLLNIQYLYRLSHWEPHSLYDVPQSILRHCCRICSLAQSCLSEFWEQTGRQGAPPASASPHFGKKPSGWKWWAFYPPLSFALSSPDTPSSPEAKNSTSQSFGD